MELKDVKGIGEKTLNILNKMNIYSIDDIINYIPRNYDIYENPVNIKDIDNKAVVAIDGFIDRSIFMKKVKNLTIITTVIKDKNNDRINVKWFNMPFLKSSLKVSGEYIFRGRIKFENNTMILEQPEVFSKEKYKEKLNSMQPVYSLKKGISNNQMIKFIKEALKKLSVTDYLDEEMLRENNLCDKEFAVRNIHFPKDFDDFKMARNRFAFDELFEFLYKMKLLKENEREIPNRYIVNNFSLSDKVLNNLPYELTNAQKRVLEEIRNDFSGKVVKQRLIQGDVGSGKTIIAFLAMLDMCNSSLTSALMVPTEVLASQHYENMSKLIKDNNLPFEVSLLTGSTTAKERKEIYKNIESGKVRLIIGTHALFQDNVIYDKLALVVIDEQHRFGVNQRSKLYKKGVTPHMIVMSATPIPRTLAIILYGDMDISVIDELPLGRLPIKNCVVTKDYRNRAYKFIKDQVEEGRQVYVICPMVDENDSLQAENVVDYKEKLEKELKNIKVSYLHGKMKPDKKNEILKDFEDNIIKVLVSTTVIEVGINVPNATVMMVENAERFGLASLHQLRGRVGRGKHQSYCIFISTTDDKDKIERLKILNESNDGFYIASKDLELRGPGDFFGIRQSGEMDFKIADIYQDGNLIKKAKKAVDEFVLKGYEFIDKNVNDDIVY